MAPRRKHTPAGGSSRSFSSFGKIADDKQLPVPLDGFEGAFLGYFFRVLHGKFFPFRGKKETVAKGLRVNEFENPFRSERISFLVKENFGKFLERRLEVARVVENEQIGVIEPVFFLFRFQKRIRAG